MNKFFKKIIDETPRDVQIFVDKYEEITMRIHQLLKLKGLTQKDLAELLGKRPSEISKWLNDGHNLTLKTISKIEAVLDENIINIPQKQSFNLFEEDPILQGNKSFTVFRNIQNKEEEIAFKEFSSRPLLAKIA
ncbi:helix-turn-helix domain-containing protein [Flavivirga eckloniae]|uniref:HTH cro/C1-type domain-containing protein n=1 Tax=Flavivirga eckloniae TaxID=1803846 RepID=A0A2K9PPY8_9FLAO|nr:helix-turn-helix transcriptional regulator [Flavivirga eckloniae]AUP79131.1 hypothetical protein C1H87_10635 [Flavivirga eckloniae]